MDEMTGVGEVSAWLSEPLGGSSAERGQAARQAQTAL